MIDFLKNQQDRSRKAEDYYNQTKHFNRNCNQVREKAMNSKAEEDSVCFKKQRKQKSGKWNSMKPKSFCKETRVKRQDTEWEAIFANNLTNGVIHSEFIKLQKIQQHKVIQLKVSKLFESTFLKRKNTYDNKHAKMLNIIFHQEYPNQKYSKI